MNGGKRLAAAAAVAAAVLVTSGMAAAKMLIPQYRQPPSTTSPAPGAQVQVDIDVPHPGRAANPLVLGNNLQWTDYGDDVLAYGTLAFNPALIDKVIALSPTVLRYPGGLLADTFRWQAGQGAAEQRGYAEVYYTRALQQVMMGTREMLELAEATHAEPLVTVNTATATAADAAQWVSYANGGGLVSSKTGAPLPRVKYWEIGNEPYLKDSRRSDLWIAPQSFAQRAAEFAVAMKAADPGILVGLPLRSDRLGGIPATPWPGYNAAMAAAGPVFDFVALHNAYLPYAYEGTYSSEALYWAAMAAYRVVEDDLAATRAQVAALWPGRQVKLAVTEYNSLFTLNGSASDAYINSLAGALYLADVLRVLAQADDLLFANFWSLSGNWHFGALSSSGVRRPAYHVLQAYRGVLRGRMLPVAIAAPTFDTPRVGFVPALQGLPIVTGLATLDGGKVRAILVNKHPDDALQVRVALGGAQLASATVRTLTGPDRFDTRDTEDRIVATTATVPVASAPYTVQLPPRSITVIEGTLAVAP